MCLQNSVTFSTLYSRVQTDMLVVLQTFLHLTTSFSSPLFPLSIKGVSFVQVLAALFLSLSPPQLAHCLAGALLLRGLISVWISRILSSLGTAGRSSEGQKVSLIIKTMIKMSVKLCVFFEVILSFKAHLRMLSKLSWCLFTDLFDDMNSGLHKRNSVVTKNDQCLWNPGSPWHCSLSL